MFTSSKPPVQSLARSRLSIGRPPVLEVKRGPQVANYSFFLSAADDSVRTTTYEGSPEGLFTSAISPKTIQASNGLLQQQPRLFRTLKMESAIALPDASGGIPGHGFTNTDVVDGGDVYILGSDGTQRQDLEQHHLAGVVIVDKATNQNVDEIRLDLLYGLGDTYTCQGVELDITDGTLWAAMEVAGVKHFSRDKVALPGSFIPAAGAANGLTIDTKRDRLICGWPVPVGQMQLDIYDRGTVPPTFIQTIVLGSRGVGGPAGSNFDAPDQLYYDAARDYVIITSGLNGQQGKGTVLKAADFTFVGEMIFDSATAMEGIYFDHEAGKARVSHDGYFHQQVPDVAQIQTYPIPRGKADVAWAKEYDLDGNLLGYLFEPASQRGNPFPLSPGAVSWAKSGVTVGALVESLTGLFDAHEIIADAGNIVHELGSNSSVAAVAGDKIVAVNVLKAGTWPYAWTGDRGDVPTHSATFNLLLGTVIGSSNCTAFTIELTDGWWACVYIYTRAFAGTIGGLVAFGDSAHSADYPVLDLNGETIQLHLHSLSEGDYLSSFVFITDEGNPETRAADTAVLPAAQLNLSVTKNTLVFRGVTARGIGASKQVFFQIDNNATTQRIRLERNTDRHLRVISTTAGVDQCVLDHGVVPDFTEFKVAFRIQANSFASSLNGGDPVIDAAGTVPVGLAAGSLRIGHSYTGEQCGGWVKELGVAPTGYNNSTLSILSMLEA